MWLGGAKAWQLGDSAAAEGAVLSLRRRREDLADQVEGAVLGRRSPPSRPATRPTRKDTSQMAAQYPDRFYGQLARERLGHPLAFPPPPAVMPDRRGARAVPQPAADPGGDRGRPRCAVERRHQVLSRDRRPGGLR